MVGHWKTGSFSRFASFLFFVLTLGLGLFVGVVSTGELIEKNDRFVAFLLFSPLGLAVDSMNKNTSFLVLCTQIK